MAAKKKAKKKKAARRNDATAMSASSAATTITQLHELHTELSNLIFDAATSGDQRNARRLQVQSQALSIELRDLNEQIIQSNATIYRELATALSQARNDARDALADLQSVSEAIASAATVTAQIARLAAVL